jgi:hypothetical protein
MLADQSLSLVTSSNKSEVELGDGLGGEVRSSEGEDGTKITSFTMGNSFPGKVLVYAFIQADSRTVGDGIAAWLH